MRLKPILETIEVIITNYNDGMYTESQALMTIFMVIKDVTVSDLIGK